MKETMDLYIQETPGMMKENIARRKELIEPLLNEFHKDNYTSIVLIASGSSYNACMCARPMMEKVMKKQVKVITPYTFEHYEYDFYDHPFVCVISQSGCSTNAIRAAKKLRALGHRVIGITANQGSDFYDGICDSVIDYGIGIEKVGYVTKGMVGLGLFFMLFALEASKDQCDYSTYIEQLNKTADAYKENYEKAKQFYKEHEKLLLSMQKVYVVAAGYNFGCALEGALKIGETVKIPAVAYELEEYIHGPNLQLAPSYTVFIIDNNDEASDHVVNIYRGTQKVTDECFILSQNKALEENERITTNIQVLPELTVLAHLSFFEYISYQVTEQLQTWDEHILMKQFHEQVKAKSQKYKES